MTTLPALNFTESSLFSALRSFLLSATGNQIEVIQGQQNRVPEPAGPDYIVYWPILRPQLGTNWDVYGDCLFTGQVSGSTLTVSSIQFGVVQVGGLLYGSSVPIGTLLLGQLTGVSGSVGTYAVSGTLSIGPSAMAAGVLFAMGDSQLDVQVDVHGPTASDYSRIITTLLRDQYAVDVFKTFGSAPPGFPPLSVGPFQLNAANYSAISPLHADDPSQVPFFNAEQQWENRWIVTARLQVNQIVIAPQQFAGVVQVTDYLSDITPIAQSQTIPVS